MKSREIRLGEFVLDTDKRQLNSVGGERIDLRNKSMDVLMMLAASAGASVSKNDLLDGVWRKTVVAEEGLVQCVADIRRAINDTDKSIVETIPGSGYRLNASVPHPTRRLHWPAAAVVLLALAVFAFWSEQNRQSPSASDHSVVAVLPLDDLSDATNRGHLSDALSEGIITELARFPQFKVIARNSSFQFRGKATDVREIGETLGADYVVEGSQQYDGRNLRVTVQLIETETGTHVLSEKLDREIADLFVIQDQIVGHVASKIGGSVLAHIPTKRSENEVDSLLRSLEARRLMQNFSRDNWQKAFELEQISVREDPQSPWGYIGMSLALTNAAFHGFLDRPKDELLNEAAKHSERALSIAPTNYMSHFAHARMLATRRDHDEAILHFEQAAELNPSDSVVPTLMSIPLLNIGETERAIAILLQAKSVDPLHRDVLWWQLGWAYWQNSECDKGLEAMLSMSSPHHDSQTMLAANYSCLGEVEKAKEAMAVYLKERPTRNLAVEAEFVGRQWTDEKIQRRWLDDMKLAGMPR